MISTPDYQGNAYIGALPPPLSLNEWVQALNDFPAYDEAERALSAEDRYICALRLTRFFRAGPRQANFARGFDAMLREGYRGRDASRNAHEARQHAVALSLEGGGIPGQVRRSSAETPPARR